MKREQLVDIMENVYGTKTSFAIYKLTDEQIKKYSNGKRYWLTVGPLSEYAYEHMTDDDIFHPQYHTLGDGFFDTEKECRLTVELYKYQNFFSSITNAAGEISKSIETFNRTIAQ